MIAAHSQVDGLALHATAVADAHPKDSDPFCEGHCVLITPKVEELVSESKEFNNCQGYVEVKLESLPGRLHDIPVDELADKKGTYLIRNDSLFPLSLFIAPSVNDSAPGHD
jgi:hypothetical protein